MKSGNPREVPQPEDDNRATQAVALLPAYTFGALDDDECLLVAEELAASPALRDEHRRYQSTVDVLAAPTPLIAPPPALRRRVLTLKGAEHAPVSIVDRRSRIALGLAAALILALGGLVAGFWSELNARENQIATLQQVGARPAIDFSQPLIWTALSASGMPGTGFFCRTEDGSVGWIIVEDLPVTAGYIYQLWLVDGDRRESAGTFVTDAEGRGFGVVRAGAPVTSFEELWVTSEPPGGSLAPTGDPAVSVIII